MSTIAERIVVTIDADADAVVRETRRAGSAVAGLGRTVSAQTRGAQAFNSVVAQQRRNLAALASVTRTATLAVGAFTAAAGAFAVREGLRFNATMESNKLALERFVGGAKEADKFLARLFETAKKTPFQFADLTQASRRLLAFGLDAEQTQQILSAFGDALAAMGGSPESIERVTIALGQIQAKGRVQAEELLQIAEAGIPVYQILQEELGLTAEEVRNIGEAGIKADEAFGALTRGLNERFAGAAAEQAKTFDGQTATLRDNSSQAMGAMTEGLFNEMKEWLPEVNATAEQIAAIWKRDDLTPEQQFERSLRAVERNLGPLFDEIERKIEQADLDQKLIGVVNKLIPTMAEAFARGAGQVALAFGRGFLEADIWGKLFLGGLFLKALGGWGAIGALGKGMGARLAGGMLAGMGPALAAAGVGAIGGALVAPKVADSLKTSIPEGEILRALQERFKLARSEAVLLFEFMREHPGLGVDEAVEQALGPLREIKREIANLSNTWGSSLNEIRQRTERNMRLIERSMDTRSSAGRAAIAENFGAAAKAIENSMDSGEIAVRKGNEATDKLLKRQLRAYGVSDPEGFLNRQESVNKAGGDSPRGKQRGGFINMGQPSGDSVPSMLERGEYVLNRNAVAAMGGKAALDALNFGMFSRFQGGGIVALGNKLQKQGYEVGEHPAFGGVSGVHTPTSYHYRGLAIDVNDDDAPGGEMASLDRLFSRLKGMPGVIELLWRVAGHFDHLHVAMAAGAQAAIGGGLGGAPIKLPRFSGNFDSADVMAQGLNQSSRGLEQAFTRALGSVEGAEPGVSAGGAGSWQAALRKIAKNRGWSVSDWMSLVMKESGGNPAAVNPSSGAFGLGQFLGATKAAYAKYGAASSDPVKQIEAMAKYISDRYGNPSAALAFHGANNWYARGGAVGSFRGGPTIGQPFHGAAFLDLREAAFESMLRAKGQRREARAERRRGRLLGRTLDAELGPIIEGLTGIPFVGAFAQGGKVLRTGLAHVHQGERITPAAKAAEAPVVHLHLDGTLAPLVKTIRGEIDGHAADVVDRQIGRRSRRLAFAPGTG